MKRKILYICLGILMLIDGALVNYILEREPVCDRTHWGDVDRTKEIVPDAETAIRIADVYFKMDKSGWGYQEGVDYQVKVTYDEPSNEWIVRFDVVVPEGWVALDGERIYGVRRDNGFVFWYGWGTDYMGCHDDF